MEYINAEEFLKQPVGVQKVFADWWKPSDGDIFWWNKDKCIDCCYHMSFMDNKDINNLKEDKEVIPLFTEGQLRKFIEDKTGGKVILTYNLLNDILIKVVKGNDIHNNALETICRYPIDRKSNVLNAYWKVACKIAKEV